MPPAPFRFTQAPAQEPASGVRESHALRVAQLLHSHYDDVWRVLRRLGIAGSVLEDCVQRVFIVASSKLERIETGKERAFLLGIAVRVAANHRRTAAVRYERASEDFESREDPSPGADELLDEKRLRAMLDEILSGLPDELRTVFVLFELEELGVSEIGETLGIPRGTAASRLRRAREAFEAAARRLRARRPFLERA
jgi:RNA polymerase sigma-70 factor (ECF subfamily)